jgi:glycosyl transferase family 25
MQDDLLGIYYISLKKDIHRRNKMSKSFNDEFEKMNYIEAVYGKNLTTEEYFNRMNHFFHNTDKLITPGELGCLMSHEKALKSFIDSDYKYALILEDDIIGTEQDIKEIRDIIINLKEEFFFHCGGMDGRKASKYIFGKKIKKNKNIFLLAEFSINHLWRASSYCIDKNTAIKLLNIYKNNIAVADEWNKILPRLKVKSYVASILLHPIELSESNLESDRLLKKDKMTLMKFLTKSVRKIKNILNKKFYKLIGYKNIYND